MSFKLPNGIPSLKTPAQDWADYAEYLALTLGTISFFDIIKQPQIISDEEHTTGIDDESDQYLQKAEEICNEVRIRSEICGSRYPFKLTDKDYVLVFDPESQETSIIYTYLLLATRAQMNKHRIQDKVDGALLFEEVCAYVFQNYFGPRAEVDILGTSKSELTNFRQKLKNLVQRMGEGGIIHENPGYRPQDDNVDVIVWKSFNDAQPSKMIAFGQCKTGTSWSDHLTELSVEAFQKTWFSVHPVVTPVRAFFTAQYFPRDLFRIRANSAGLVFDRFRIIDYMPDHLEPSLLTSINKWNSDILAFYK